MLRRFFLVLCVATLSLGQARICSSEGEGA